MAANILAMHAVLDKLDTDLANGITYPNKTSQQQFWKQVTHGAQLGNDRGAHCYSADTLRQAVGYTLRDKRRKTQHESGAVKIYGQQVMDQFFATGSIFLEPGFLKDAEVAVKAHAAGTYVPESKSKRKTKLAAKIKSRSGLVVLKVPPGRAAKRVRSSTDPICEGEELAKAESHAHKQGVTNRAVNTLPFTPVNSHGASVTAGPTSASPPITLRRQRKISSELDHDLESSLPTSKELKATDLHPSPPPQLWDTTDCKKRKAESFYEAVPNQYKKKRLLSRTSHTTNGTRLLKLTDLSLPSHRLAVAALPRTPSIPLGCISKAEVLEDVRSINFEINELLALATFQQSNLNSDHTYLPSSSVLSSNSNTSRLTQSPHDYMPASPVLHSNTACAFPSSLSNTIWSNLIRIFFSLPYSSAFSGLFEPDSATLKRAVLRTSSTRILDADGIVRELALAQLRDPDFAACNTATGFSADIATDFGLQVRSIADREEVAILRAMRMIWSKAWTLREKLSLSREHFMVVRDEAKAMTGVVRCTVDEEQLLNYE